MERIEDHPGLTRGDGWYEIAYATGDAEWPFARVRITPVVVDQDERIHQPNADPVPPRVEIRASASLIDEEGRVERIAGKLLLGQETTHSWQFHANVEFDPTSWLDKCSERIIEDLLKQARGIKIAVEEGLLFK